MKRGQSYLFFALMFVFCSESNLSFSQNIIFVTQNGAGNQSGTSWSNAKSGNDLPGVLSNASGKEVWIAEGTYRPSTNNNRSERFKIKYGCEIYGGFSGTETQLSQRDSSLTIHKTIFSGEIQNDNSDSNNTYNIVQIDSVSNPVYLNSLIVEGSNTAPSHQVLDDAAVNIEHATVHLGNMEIRNSKPTGIYIQGSKVYIDHSNIHDNQGNGLGGGISASDDVFTMPPHQNYVSIEKTRIHDNYASGGSGLFFRFGTPADTLIMENCKIDHNVADVMGAAGLFLDAGQTAILNKVELMGNSSQVYNNGGEGLFMDGGNLFVNDALIAENFNGGGSGLGGGVFLQAMQKAKFVNCTFANNSADSLGPGYFHFNQLFIASGNVKFENCIFKSPMVVGTRDDMTPDTLNNFGPPTGWNYYSHDVSFANCLFDSDFPAFWTDSGNNITNAAPGFVGQYVLSQNSPAIDAGNNSFRNVNYSDDLAGNARIVNGIVDLGAQEFQGNGNPNGLTELASGYIRVYPNPFTESIIIKGAKIGSTFCLYNISGQSVLQGRINKPAQLIDLSLLANGVYFLGLTSSDNRNVVMKCVKR